MLVMHSLSAGNTADLMQSIQEAWRSGIGGVLKVDIVQKKDYSHETVPLRGKFIGVSLFLTDLQNRYCQVIHW